MLVLVKPQTADSMLQEAPFAGSSSYILPKLCTSPYKQRLTNKPLQQL